MDLILPGQVVQPSIDSNIVYWPVFGAKENIKKFWNNKRNFQPQTFIFQAEFLRLGKKKQKPKTYYFSLTEDYVLCYSKKKGDKQKGSLQLNLDILMCLSYFPVNDEKCLGLRFYRSDKTSILVYTIDNANKLFELWELLSKTCPMNNFEEMYQPISMLGKGSFATVYKVKRLMDDQTFAAKIYYKETYNTNTHKAKFALMVQNEVIVLASVNHPGIATLHEIYQQIDKVVIIIEYVQGPDLYQLIKKKKVIQEQKACFLIQQIASSLQKLHAMGFVHRDLKLENILLQSFDSYDTKIVDFGFAEKINSNTLTSKAGTPGYIPPELYANKPYIDKGDIFSLGVLLFSLVGGYSPFKGKTYKQIMEQNRLGVIVFDKPIWNVVSKECQDVILMMCDHNPEIRLSASQILDLPWIRLNSNQLDFSMSSHQLVESVQQDFFSPNNQQVPSFYQKSNNTFKTIQLIGQIQESKGFIQDEDLKPDDVDEFYENNTIDLIQIHKMQKAQIVFKNIRGSQIKF